MTNGNDLIQHEEQHWNRLIESFIDKNKLLWELHILQDYSEQEQINEDDEVYPL